MNRLRRSGLLALIAAIALSTPAWGATAWLSLNLQFNTPGNLASGGTWTAVGKAEPQGFAGIAMYTANTSFGSFLAPARLDVRLQSGNTTIRNIAIGDDLVPPYPLGIGVIGSPSTYVDPAGLVPYGAYPSYGSFTGGVALATGTFAPGVVPDWTPSGINVTDANLFTGAFPAPVADANTLLTVRYVVPEPTAIRLTAWGAIGLAFAIRRRRTR